MLKMLRVIRIMPFLCFFLDFLLFALLDMRLMRGLELFFLCCVITPSDQKRWESMIILLPLLLVENCFFSGRFGFEIVYLVPIVWLARNLSTVVRGGVFLLPSVLFAVLISIEAFVKIAILGQKTTIEWIFFISCCNISILVLVLKFSEILGMRGNRSCSL